MKYHNITQIILDFDGTITNIEAETIPSIQKWHELYCERTNTNINDHKEEINEIKREVILDEKSGWINNGKVVAPASADPLILITTVYQKLIQKHISEGKYPLDTDQKSVDALLYELFTKSYPYADKVFLPGAKEFLYKLTSKYDVTIVTNSKTEEVEKKLAMLVNYPIKLIGNAKKYVVGNDPDWVPESINIQGFPREVFLRRSNYNDILNKFNPTTTAVIGDIYELDLALPEYLGFKAIQIAIPTTPKYELRRSNTLNYYLAKDYNSIIKRLEE